jgi:hypothetical protein
MSLIGWASKFALPKLWQAKIRTCQILVTKNLGKKFGIAIVWMPNREIQTANRQEILYPLLIWPEASARQIFGFN